MENLKETLEDRKVRFAVIAIEEGAKKLGVAPWTFCQRLARHDLINGRLMKFYDTLHTQSKAYVADDIVETLLEYENAEEK